MQVQVRLLHCDGTSRVVLASAREGERFLGSALGEAATAEEAEDRARARLRASLAPADRAASSAPTAPAAPAAPAVPAARPPASTTTPAAVSTPPPRPGAAPPPAPEPQPPAALPLQPTAERPEEDPEDWSAELTRLDLQMRRLGWDREREATYLQRCFGHPSRDRITVYADLMSYLQMVEGFEPGCDPASAPVPLRRSDLLRQCDLLLQQLGWDGRRGRSFLEQHLAVASRQQLRDTDLLRFNMLLEEETLKASADGLPVSGPQTGIRSAPSG